MTESRYTTQEQIDEMRLEIARALEKREPGKRRTGRLMARVFGWAIFGLVIAVLLSAFLSILVAKKSGRTPSIMGYHLFRIETGSMDPTLTAGSVILSKKPRDASALNEGDIVTFKASSGTLVTHRIFRIVTDEKGQTGYITKGDNPVNDPDSDLLFPDGVLAVFLLKIPLT